MNAFSFLIFSYFFILIDCTKHGNFVIQLIAGRIQGKEHIVKYSPFGSQTAHVYLGIPFAKPPIGNLRFRKAETVEKWNGIQETKEYKPACMSKSVIIKTTAIVSEDCLYANVFTNHYCMENKNCSVMFVVHGGAYVIGSASSFDADIIINNFVGQGRNIVVVTVNYRLGVFGFGHLNGEYDGSADKNIGLYDLLEGLQWTKREISKFGGSPDRVSVLGHSGGANLVFHLATSPLTKRLIHQQIIMSGPIPAHSKIGNTKATRAIAVRVGCLPENGSYGKLATGVVKNAFDCMRNLDANTLLDAQSYVSANSTSSFGAPYIDGEMVTDYEDKVLKTGNFEKVNTLIGALTAELRETSYIQNEAGVVIIDRLKQLCSQIGWRFAYTDPMMFEELCVNEYSKNFMAQFLIDDMEYYSPAINIANANTGVNTSAFVYSYAYSGAGPLFRRMFPNSLSPTHSEDQIYLLGSHRGENMQPKDYMIEKVYSGMVSNFINFGDPSPSEYQKWKPFTNKLREYFTIDFDENFNMPGMSTGYNERANRIWNIEIPRKAGPIRRMERFPPSFDTLIGSTLTMLAESHFKNMSMSISNSFETVERGYKEMETFLKQLKMEYKLGNMTFEEPDLIEKIESCTKTPQQTWKVMIIIFLTILIIVLLYTAITRWMENRKRAEYQLIK